MFALEISSNGNNNIVIPTGFIVILAAAFLLFVFWIWSLIEVLRTPERTWRADDRRQVSWILVIVLLGWLGSLLYVVIARPSLKRAT
jgi:uncharacterized protein HemY